MVNVELTIGIDANPGGLVANCCVDWYLDEQCFAIYGDHVKSNVLDIDVDHQNNEVSM